MICGDKGRSVNNGLININQQLCGHRELVVPSNYNNLSNLIVKWMKNTAEKNISSLDFSVDCCRTHYLRFTISAY